MSDQAEKFESWALVEIMGRQRIVGRVSEAVIAGAGMLRVDVPEQDGKPGFTRFYSPSSVYCISPVAEQVALELLKSCRNEPVARYEIPQLAEKYNQFEPEDDDND